MQAQHENMILAQNRRLNDELPPMYVVEQMPATLSEKLVYRIRFCYKSFL